MGRANLLKPLRILQAVLLAIWAGLFAVPAAGAGTSDGFAPGSTCWVSGKKTLDYAQLATQPDKWTCGTDPHDWQNPRHIVRFDLRGRTPEASLIRHAEFDRHEFEQLTARLIGPGGETASRSYSFDEIWLGKSSLQSMIDLPQLDAGAQVLVLTVDNTHWPDSFTQAELREKPSAPPIAGFAHLVAALICGLLLAPILFDLGYFRALRESFPLWHALFCAMAFVQTAAVSGLIPLLIPIDFLLELYITYMSLDVMVAAAMIFASSFLEPETLSRRNRLILLAIAPIVIADGAATTFFPELFGSWINHVYFGVYVMILALFFGILWQARRAGSRMAPYLILGFAPLASVVVVQFAGVFGFGALEVFDETWPQTFALLFEVIATALAVADRFIAIKRERDIALDEARNLEFLSERDELTGLRNRRSLDARFEDLVAEGFHTIAVIDIDHFKPINDLYGHPFGDRVLVCIAGVLRAGDDEDLVSFRVGGEEFLVMLRGDDAIERAEQRRTAIAAHTQAVIEDLDRPVTASMGLLDFSAVADDAKPEFRTLYTRADQLLYEAKCAGRDQMRHDRLEWFVPQAGQAESVAA